MLSGEIVIFVLVCGDIQLLVLLPWVKSVFRGEIPVFFYLAILPKEKAGLVIHPEDIAVEVNLVVIIFHCR